VALGRLLLHIKAVVGHGNFKDWVTDHFPGSYAMAREAMRAAKILDNQTAAVQHFGPSAVRLLTKERLAKTVREKLLKNPPAEGPARIGFTRALLRTLADDATLERPADASSVDDDVTDEEKAFLRLSELLERSGMIHFSIDRDPDCPTISLTFYPTRTDERPVTICRRSLHTALAAAVGQEEMKRCPKCTQIKSADAFAKSTAYCRICERARVKEYTQSQQAAAAGKTN